ncbi:hypothetical protein [Litorisediminicola beolgyonensis]|uniref:Uncharacterized protein n=1 Tax=Litorisediminicola beolgyonensis TaxID=1173614 RepID=A0ABW3ZIF9_9RHOB
MSTRLLYWLNAPDVAWLDPADTPLALGTLALMVAEAQPGSCLAAPGAIDRVLAERYDLTRREAAEMRSSCDRVARGAPALAVYGALIRAHVPEPERRAFLSTLAATLAETQPETDVALGSAFGIAPDTARLSPTR